MPTPVRAYCPSSASVKKLWNTVFWPGVPAGHGGWVLPGQLHEEEASVTHSCMPADWVRLTHAAMHASELLPVKMPVRNQVALVSWFRSWEPFRAGYA
jgi:hypothetical protein